MQGPGQTLRGHFALVAQQKLTTAVYLNYEAVHDTADADYFLASTLFKRNLIAVGHSDPRVARWTQAKVRVAILMAHTEV